MHLIIDAHVENKELMVDKELMAEWLDGVARVAGMSPFGEPFIYGYPWPGSSDWTAITAFLPLMESGLVVHCWPEKEAVFIDLFTCGEVERDVEDRIIEYIVRTFRMQRPRIILLNRGVDSKTGEVIPARVREESC